MPASARPRGPRRARRAPAPPGSRHRPGRVTPPRVVSLDPAVTDVVRALGCGAWLVGRSHACEPPEPSRELPAVTSMGGSRGEAGSSFHVDALALAALHPDLVLSPEPCRTLDDIWREVRRIADTLHVPERGVQLVTRLTARLRAVAERAAALGARPRVAFLERADPPAAAGDWIPELVVLAGGEDPFGAPGAPARRLGWSELLAADPDVLWVAPPGHGLPEARAASARLAARADWGRLRAVREHRVYVGDGLTLFHRAGPRVTDALEALAESIHPGAFRFGHEGRGWARGAGAPGPGPATDP